MFIPYNIYIVRVFTRSRVYVNKSPLSLYDAPTEWDGKNFKRSVAESVSVEFCARQGLGTVIMFRSKVVIGAHEVGVPLNGFGVWGVCG